jgi:hypothetical protein
MTILNVKEWLACKPEERKALIEQGKKLSKLMWQEEIIEQAVESFSEAIDTIEYELCEGKSYEWMNRTYEWAARAANDIYRAEGYERVCISHPHLTDVLPIYYQMWIDDFKEESEREEREAEERNKAHFQELLETQRKMREEGE